MMPTLAATEGLTRADFQPIATQGFGDPLNSYAHGMAWFRDEIFVGTTRANLALIKVHDPPRLRLWPTPTPDDVYDLDLRAQIWRYSPKAGTWRRAFTSPYVTGRDSQRVPRDLGYRGMTVFKAPRDPAAALYVAGWSGSRVERPPVIMRSRDGDDFVPVSDLDVEPQSNSYRTLLELDGRLYTAPTGRTGGKPNVAAAAVVLETGDPESGSWRPVCEPGFGDPTNLTVFEMSAFDAHLYVGTLNPTHGFELWKCRPDGAPPYAFTKVITDGAYRGNLNETAISMCAFNGALYIGLGIQGGGFDRAYGAGPAAAEIIRVHPDDTWDLIVGEQRRTPRGLKAPLSGLGPGFDNFFNGYVWRMAEHDGWLYAGTYNWAVFMPFVQHERWPVELRRVVARTGAESFVERDGGFDLWRSRDGVTWTAVTTSGLDNPYNFGVRSLVSTPDGLFLGTANPFGPKVAVDTRQGWRYVDNPRGGLEIWRGARASDNPQRRAAENGGERRRPGRPSWSVATANGQMLGRL